jgi:hypothetical protein
LPPVDAQLICPKKREEKGREGKERKKKIKESCQKLLSLSREDW